MPSLKTTVPQTYPAAILRVYRSLQVGQLPNLEDARRAAQATQWNWDILSNPHLSQATISQTNLKVTDVPVGSVAARLAIVQDWIEATHGWVRLRAGHDAGRTYDPVGILILAESCEWAKLADASGLPSVQQGKMHPACLELGVGSYRDAYRHDKSGDARVYFFTAYKA